METKKVYRGQWAGSSHLKEKVAELTANHNSDALKEIQERLAAGEKIVSCHKRPRIKKVKNPKQVVVSLGEGWTLRLSFSDYLKRGDGLKIIMRIY